MKRYEPFKFEEGKIIIKDETEEALKILNRNKIKYKKLDRFGKSIFISNPSEYEHAKHILDKAFIEYK
jgi:hypothetical protein